jgi:hypothetical protein
VVEVLRKKCGNHDPIQAKISNPKSLRAIFGVDKINNAV